MKRERVKPEQSKLGSNLDYLRKHLGLSVKELARCTGLSRQTVWAYIHQPKRRPRPDNLKPIADFLGKALGIEVTVSALLYLDYAKELRETRSQFKEAAAILRLAVQMLRLKPDRLARILNWVLASRLGHDLHLFVRMPPELSEIVRNLPFSKMLSCYGLADPPFRETHQKRIDSCLEAAKLPPPFRKGESTNSHEGIREITLQSETYAEVGRCD